MSAYGRASSLWILKDLARQLPTVSANKSVFHLSLLYETAGWRDLAVARRLLEYPVANIAGIQY